MKADAPRHSHALPALLLLILCALGARAALARHAAEPAHGAPWLVDINRAGEAELQLLPRIGPAMAERIGEDRALHGPFAAIDDLQRVRGVGPRTVMQVRPYAAAN